MLTFDGVWNFREVFSSWINPGFHCTGHMADIMYGVVWVSVVECCLVSILICHTCEVMDYLGKREVLTNTDLDRFVNNI